MKAAKLLLALFCLPVFAFCQTANQTKTLTALTQKFIALYNTGDTAQYRAFARTIDPSDAGTQRSMEQFTNEKNFLGRVDVKNIRVVSPTETQTLVQTPHFEAWWQVIVLTDSLQHFKEHHMRRLRVTDEVLGNKTYSKEELAAAIDSFVKRQSVYEPFNGNVLIQKGGTPVYARSFGSSANGKAHTMQDAFDLASVGKLFTAIAILQLVEQGKLALTDSVGGLLPELKNKKLAPITIEQLLTHTSGMGDFFEDPQFHHIIDSTRALLTAAANRNTPTEAAFMPFFEKEGLRFAPGTDWAYSNTGFELLGYILEKQTGLSYKDYITKNIFQPAGMTSSEAGSGSGAGRATAADIIRFTNALKGAKLLHSDLTQQFFQHQVNDHYGWGSERQKLANETIVGHSGGFENVCNEVNLYTRSGYTVVILSNSNPPFGHFLSDKIKTLLVQKAL